MDDLGFVKTVDRFGESIVIGVADAADGGLDASLSQALGVFDRDVFGGFKRSSQRDPSRLIEVAGQAILAGVFQSSVLRGRELRAAATAAISSALCMLRSVPLGKYCRSSPLVFSFVPRCHGLCGSQK